MRKFKHSFKSPRKKLFHWTGISVLGEPRFGQIQAQNRTHAKQHLRAQRIIIKTLSASRQWSRGIRPGDVTYFIQQLTNLISANLSIQQALMVILSCQNSAQHIALLSKIQRATASGSSLSEAMQQQSRWFNPFVCALIHLGEQSGILASMLQQITTHLTKQERLQQQLRTILSYPLLVFGVASLLTIHLIVTVVPQFQSLFQHAHGQLPTATRLLIQMAAFLKTYGLLTLLLGCGLICLVYILYLHVLRIKRCCHHWLLKLPYLGKLCQFITLARSFNALAVATQAGLPLVDALQWIAQAAGNLCFTQAFLQIRTALMQGDSIRNAVYHARIFPELVVHMLSLGEESGTLQTLLTDLSDYYAQQVEQHMQRLSRLIEPIIMLMLGGLVGGLILAMYLPIMQLGTLL
jgi:type IV pilus assembly protein PilC